MTTQTAIESTVYRDYETIYILRPTTKPADAEKTAARLADVVQREKATMTQVDVWGNRRLAYPIERHARGIFVYMRYVGFGPVVHEVERNLHRIDDVIRFQTVKLGDTENPAKLKVDPDDVKFVPVDDIGDDEDVTVEQRLGLPSPRPPRESSHRDDYEASGRDAEPVDADDVVAAEAAASAAPAAEPTAATPSKGEPEADKETK